MRAYGLLVLLLVGGAAIAQAGLLWDNFLTPNPPVDGGFDRQSYFSSERNAAVQDTWATDDAVFTHDVIIQGIKWAGACDPRFTYTVEVIILKQENQTYTPLTGFPLTIPTYQVTGTFGNFYGFQTYNGYVDLPDTPLNAGHYYFGVRLVSGPTGQGDGRNVALTTGNGQINGQTMGLVRPGPPPYYDWIFIDQYPGEPPTDFAFQLYGIPEPTSLALLGLGLMLQLRRRLSH